MIDQDRPAWLGALAHELRTPLASILGYAELVEDGIFGPIDPRAADAVRRMRYAALHLGTLIDGVDRLGDAGHVGEEPEDVPLREIFDEAIDTLRVEAEGRNVTFDITGGTSPFRTVRDDAVRAVTLALSAAIKASPGARFEVELTEDAIIVRNTKLTAADDVASLDVHHMSGPALRIVLARQAIRFVNGTILLDADGQTGGTLRIQFGTLPAAEAM